MFEVGQRVISLKKGLSTILEQGKVYKVTEVSCCVKRKAALDMLDSFTYGNCKICVERCLVKINKSSLYICSYAFKKDNREDKLKRILND